MLPAERTHLPLRSGGLDSRESGNDRWDGGDDGRQTPPLHTWRGGRGVRYAPGQLKATLVLTRAHGRATVSL